MVYENEKVDTMLSELIAFDEATFRFINQQLASPFLDSLMMFISNRYTWVLVGLLFLLFACAFMRRTLLPLCLMMALTIGLTDLVTYQVLKPTFARDRPCRQFQDIHLVPEFCGGDHGFPSNHAANGMAVTVLLALNSNGWVALTALLMTILVGFSRIYLGVHFPGDVLAGFLCGAIFGLIIHVLIQLLKKFIVGLIKVRRSNQL